MSNLTTWVKRAIVVSLLGVSLDLGISGVLSYQQDQIRDAQNKTNTAIVSAQCWDGVLTTAIRDHLTPAQRTALLTRANHCADITDPQKKSNRG